jgi:hypothetical protein
MMVILVEQTVIRMERRKSNNVPQGHEAPVMAQDGIAKLVSSN